MKGKNLESLDGSEVDVANDKRQKLASIELEDGSHRSRAVI